MKILIMLIISINSYAFDFPSKSSILKKIKENINKTYFNEDNNTDSQSGFEITNPENGNHKIKNFNEAKKIFKKTHYLGQTKTLYCMCDMTDWNQFDNKNCGYKNKKYQSQWQKIEAEHLVPFSQILSGTKAYKYGDPKCGNDKGRKCADKIYGFIAGDLWILGPAELELNRVHSDYQWAELGNRGESFGSCDFYYEDKKVQPPMHLKGKIARAYMYIEDTYKIKVISNKNEKLFNIWAKYKPTVDQCKLAKKIIEIQGNINKFEVNACKESNLW